MTNFICHWRGLTYLWSISFWMSLFSSSTFCWSFFLLCSGGRLLKSSGPAPCTDWNEGGEGRNMKKKSNQSLKESFRTAFWKQLENICAKSQWSEALLSSVPSYLSLNGQVWGCLRNQPSATSCLHTKQPMGDHQLKNARVQWQTEKPFLSIVIIKFYWIDFHSHGKLIFPAFLCSATDHIPIESCWLLLLRHSQTPCIHTTTCWLALHGLSAGPPQLVYVRALQNTLR